MLRLCQVLGLGTEPLVQGCVDRRQPGPCGLVPGVELERPLEHVAVEIRPGQSRQVLQA